ncbi:hypothetical protein SDC9_200122 [bioreactor metagenome]|uniref:Uncharacterized protein n=1 Tax=bioreactor metagenome TaxID=1076179 RepID=A0A645IMY6_9ZZZZ
MKDDVRLSGCTCTSEDYLFAHYSLRRPKLAHLPSVLIHPCQHDIHAGESMGDPLSEVSQHLG